MTVVLVTPPAVEPVGLAEAKAHLRIEHDADDTLVSALVTAARVHVEVAIRRVMIDQTWRIYRDDWPASGLIELPVGPVRAVGAVVAYDGAGIPSTLLPSQYTVDIASVPARIALRSPLGLRPGAALNGVEIDIDAGYGTSGLDVPQPLRQAIMMLAARWYEVRDGSVIGTVPGPIADAYEALIAPYRILRLR